MPNYYTILRLTLFMALLLSPALSHGIRILTTVNVLADAAHELCQNTTIKVDSLMGPGVDPHLYRMTAGDLGKIRKSQLVLAMGLHLEGKMYESLEKLAKKQSVAFLGEKIPPEQLLNVDPDSKNHDPHIWFDPNLWLQVVNSMAAEISRASPTDAATIEINRKRFTTDIQKTAIQLRSELQTVPKKKRVLITSHDAFRYFARYFEFEVHGILGVSTDSEVGVKRIQELIALIRSKKIRSIFIENSVPPALIEGLQAASGAKIGGELFGDSLGDRDTPEGRYLGMLRHNIQTIKKGLE